MNWLTLNDAKVRFRNSGLIPQTISVGADVSKLYEEIPLPPELGPREDGVPSPVHRWYAVIQERLVEIECQVTFQRYERPEVILYTPFSEKRDQRGDWTVLCDLEELPPSIHLTRPSFIENRVASPTYVLYRPDPRGWAEAIYRTDCRAESEALLNYLVQDTYNASCFIGEPEVPGEWGIVQLALTKEQVRSVHIHKNLQHCRWHLKYRLSKSSQECLSLRT